MAVAFVNSASLGSTGLVTTLAANFTATAGADMMYVGLSTDTATPTNHACTYNSVAGTKISGPTAQQGDCVFRWKDAEFPTGSSLSLSASWTTSVRACWGVYTFSGVDQTTPEGTISSNTSAGATSTSSTGVTLTANDMALDSLSLNGTTSAQLTVGGGQANAIKQGPTDVTSDTQLGMSTLTGTGTVTPSWSWSSGSQRYGHIIVPILTATVSAARLPQPYLVSQAVNRAGTY